MTRTSSSGGRSAVGGDDRVTPGERPDRHALELEHGVLGEALLERLPVAGAHALVVARDVLVEEVDRRRQAEILADEPEQDAVGPLAVAPVRLALHPFADEADPLGVGDRALVEAVDLQLQPVEAELEQEVALELSRGLLRQARGRGSRDGRRARRGRRSGCAR